MEVFTLSGGSASGCVLEFEVNRLELAEKLKFMNPDQECNHPPDARRIAATKWPGLRVLSKRSPDKRVKPYFRDVIGAGFYVPGCTLCVSDRARIILEPILGDSVQFLSLDVVGAPSTYWVMYPTQYYYGALDHERIIARASYNPLDSRKTIYNAAFMPSDVLNALYVFRLPSSAEYRCLDFTFATQKFMDVVNQHKLSGFGFLKLFYKGYKLPPSESVVYVSPGPKVLPDWA
jgi:hypothetical protein